MASNGVYGTRIPSNIDLNEVDIFYSFSPTRNSNDVDRTSFTKLDASALLQKVNVSSKEENNGLDTLLEGMYNLKLPIDLFNEKGFYTVYIKPKEHPVVLLDVAALSSYPDVKGLVVDTTSISDDDENFRIKMQNNNQLVGYRIIYIDNNYKRQNYYRIVTSNNKCEPVVQNLTDTNTKAIRYRYNETSSLTFITVTPSVASTFKPNAVPYIGVTAQKVLFVDTSFEPLMLEIEMTEHDADTISTMLEGNQLRDLDNGLVTTFNDNNEIYHQSEHYTLKDSETNNPIYEVRKNKVDSIDTSQSINDKL